MVLNCTSANVFGVVKTVAGGNSIAAAPGLGKFQYPSTQAPYTGCDNNVGTTALNFGPCTNNLSSGGPLCGLATGIYITTERNTSLAVGFQFCAGGDFSERDPTMITLEGSNANGTKLTLGSSWTLLYNGTGGLDNDPGRTVCGDIVSFSNMMTFQSYRMLITAKRSDSNCAQYSEFRLLET